MFKRILKILSSKITFFAATTAFILGLNLTPLIVHINHAPVGRNFPLIHNNVQDYFFYLSLMNEGSNGKWLTSDPFTSEPHKSSIIFAYFLWLGKLSKLLGLSNPITYHLIRIMISILFLSFIYYILYFIKIPYPRLTYFFFLFAAPFMHTINDYGNLRSVPFMYWWNGIDPIRRAAFLPHHMMGGLLLVLSIILIFQYIKNPARRCLAKLILLSAIMAFVNTPSLLILLLVLPSTLLLYFIVNNISYSTPKFSIFNFQFSLNFQKIRFKNLDYIKNFKFQISNYSWLLVYWIIGLLSLIFMVSQTKNGFPWSQYIDWEKNLQFPLTGELLPAMGILLPFSLVGIFSALKSKKFEYIFIVCWLVIPFIFIPIAPKVNLSNIRLIQGIPYLPMAILTTIGLSSVNKILFPIILSVKSKIKNQKSKIPIKNKIDNISRSNIKFSQRTHGTVNYKKILHASEIWLKIAILATFIVFTYPTLSWSLKDQIREYWPIFGNVYLDNRLFEAFKYINNNYGSKTVTLSTFYTGNYLPAYTNTTSFIGHFGYTANEKEKEKEVDAFFRNKMTVKGAKQFLVSNKITLVFQGPEEKPLYTKYLYPTILKPVYDKEEVTIYILSSPT